MGIVNKRNAFVGWIVIKNRKRVVKEMVRAVPVSGRKIGAIAGGAAAATAGIAGGLLFWRKTRAGGGDA